ncbi:hypothetical protein QBC40DRAFT_235588 [Triangularia verruculosa]|uniref:Uncharacterized protein n=1 Tax=Triangularia verruculosa TaxID=2587418 RepID=A0AAN6X8K2_9PEZI|nr:hypothetical protein QBC40DRAFT_235588 [Triangularia verruculosa]
MGRPEDLPEVVPKAPTPLPEVVPDSGPQTISNDYVGDPQRAYVQYKYHVDYDGAPKFPFEPPTPTADIYLQNHDRQPLWPENGQAMPVSALSPNSSSPWDAVSPVGKEELYVGPREEEAEKKRICGLGKRTFIMVLVAVIVLLGAAVGGSVAGVMKARHNEDSPPKTTTPAATETSLGRPAASSLDNETPNVGFMFQAWKDAEYKGNKTPVYIEEGFYNFPFMAWSYVWFPNKTDCCLTFCASPTNHTPTGWWCNHRRRPKTDRSFGRINIWCGRGSNTSNQKKCNGTQIGGEWTD